MEHSSIHSSRPASTFITRAAVTAAGADNTLAPEPEKYLINIVAP